MFGLFGLEIQKRCRMFTNRVILRGILALMLAPGTGAVASTLDADIDALAAQVNKHVANVEALEQALLYPVSTRLTVFLTLEAKDALDLDSVELFLNDRPVASHLYSPREREALDAGGVQQLYLGNLPSGSHELKVVITARSANDSFVRREASHTLEKTAGALGVQMNLGARAPDFEPRVSFVEWK